MSPDVAPEIARIWLNVDDAITTKSTIAVTRSVPLSESTIAFHVSDLNARARISTPRTPNAADSDGVAIPRIIRPITMKMMTLIGRR